MKKTLLTLMSFAVACSISAQLSQIVLESTTSGEFACGNYFYDQPEGLTTYRLYAEVEDPEDFVSAMFAIGDCYPMNFSTTTSFYNNVAFGRPIGAQIMSALCAALPEENVGFDSWLTIGVADNSTPGAAISEAWTDPVDPTTLAFHTENGGDFVANDGVFFTTNGNIAGIPVGPNNRVLLGQFTTDGEFSYQFNLNVFDDGSNTNDNSHLYLAFADIECTDLVGTTYDGRGLGLIYPYTGCFDTTACNYNPEALEDDPSSCCFGTCGCSLEYANNYDPDATCGITENCEFGINGTVYNDVNLNGELDASDVFLEGITVELPQVGLSTTTNAAGEYSFPDLYGGMHRLVVQPTDEYAYFAHISPKIANSIPGSEYHLGMSTEPSTIFYYYPDGVVFNDENQDGVRQPGELGVPDVTVEIFSNDLTMVTNENGEFSSDPFYKWSTWINGWNEGNLYNWRAIRVVGTEDFPYTTNSYPYQMSHGPNGNYQLGISEELPYLDFNCWYHYDEMVLCNTESTNNFLIRNQSNVPISGVVEVELSPLYTNMTREIPFDSIVDGKYYMSFTDVPPGALGGLDGGNATFTTPSPDFLNEPIFINTHVWAYYNNEPIGEGDHQFLDIVTCAYDPNDLQAFPRGYSDDHYVLPSTNMEYKVRFQNTGNAPAIDVLVQDTIPEYLDLNSIQILEHSHDIEVTIDETTRVVNFMFSNIQLPDSFCCEPESHGEFIFLIEMMDDLAPETRIENTAYIYFDNNPAVVTNTTWTTIYECTQDLADFSIAQAEICADETIEAQGGEELIEDYSWMINDETLGEESALNLEELEPGVYDLQLTVNNPLCEAESMQSIEVFELPNAAFDGATGNLLIADDPNLNTYQWYLDGNLIDGATSSEFTFEETGAYSLEVSNDAGCSSLSEELIMNFVSINELNANVLSMYPNPVEEQLFVEFAGTAQRQIQIYSIDGRLVKELNCNSNKCSVDVSDLASGKYELVVLGEQTSKSSFVKR